MSAAVRPAEEALAEAERLFSQGEALLAYDAVAEAQEAAPGDGRLRLLMARIHLKLGFVQKAMDQLRGLGEGPWADAASALLGRAHKDLWRAAPDDPALLALAIRHYQDSFDRNPSIWAGINLATLEFLAGRPAEAERLARPYAQSLAEALEDGGLGPEDHYWHLATLGEARLLLGDRGGAAQALQAAVRVPGIPREFHLSTLRNLELLGARMDLASIQALFPVPTVLCFGPYGREAKGRAGAVPLPAIHSVVCGLAAPWDLDLAEQLVEAQYPVHIVVPYEPERMVQDYWEPRGMSEARIEALLRAASQVVVVGRWPGFADGESVAFANQVLEGYGRLRAEQIEGRARWIAPPGQAREADLGPGFRSPAQAGRKTMSILFADVVKFSRLSEAQTSLFAHRFLGLVAGLIRSEGFRPADQNTWGDGLVFTFEDAETAGRFAVLLSRLVQATDWAALGLPEGLNLRISLHAGPVTACLDPIRGVASFTGHQVVTSARMEPITPPGEVFVSLAYAALLAATGSRWLRPRYSGRIPLPKNAGFIPVFALQGGAS